MDKNIIRSLYEKYSSKKYDVSELINKYDKKYIPEDVLSARETRVCRQEKLIARYKASLISIRVNYPGVRKNNYITLYIIKVLYSIIVEKFKNKILYHDFDITAEGPIGTLVINELKENVKRITVDLEENLFLGRCVDIDVYGKMGESISRRELGLKDRKCYVCQRSAQSCVRERRHGIEEVEEFIRKRYEDYIKYSIKDE
ncbi:Holo-ACP synthase CitX [Clostridiaceae bacterium BL-3]|nr:Holo-ACP synthase CitX [Clostridiaceae bacterium BL-3]